MTMLLLYFSRVHINFVIIKLFILISKSLQLSSAYVFTTCHLQVSHGGGDSWIDYILIYFKTRFTIYALPLTNLLKYSLRFKLSLQTIFLLHSPLIIYNLLCDFIIDDKFHTKHLFHMKLKLSIVGSMTP